MPRPNRSSSRSTWINLFFSEKYGAVAAPSVGRVKDFFWRICAFFKVDET